MTVLDETLRREALAEISRLSELINDYSLKLGDAVEEHGDCMLIAGRLQQIRLCTMAAIHTYNLFLRREVGNGEDMAKESHEINDQNNPAGNGIPRVRPE